MRGRWRHQRKLVPTLLMRRGFIWLGVSPSPQVESFANLGNALLAKGRLHASRSAFGALLLFSVSMRPLLRHQRAAGFKLRDQRLKPRFNPCIT